MPRKKMSTNAKAMTVGGTAGVLVTYGAGLVQAKYGVPLEVASVVVGGIFSFIGRWAGKLLPDA